MERRQKIAEIFDDYEELEGRTIYSDDFVTDFESQSPILQVIKSENDNVFMEQTLKDFSGDKATPTMTTTTTKTAKTRPFFTIDYLKRTGHLRWFILALSCFIMFGNFYAYDNPSALNRQLRAWMSDGSDAEFEYHLNLLYMVYSAPNIILPFIVGRSLDRYGSRYLLIWLSLLMCLGQTIFSLGVSWKSWGWMFLGRLVFGVGGESLAVAQSRLVTEWFLGKELGLAIGLNLSVARIGTVFNNNASPRIASMSQSQGGGVSGACWVGLATCLFSLICTLLCIIIDTLYRPEDAGKRKSLLKNSKSLDNANDIEIDTQEFINPVFYFLLLLNFLSYGAVLCFNTVASAYLQERYFPGKIFAANWAMSIPDTAAIFVVPLMGLAVDRTGFKQGTISLGQAALAFGHFWLAVSKSPSKPYGALFILGIGYSTLLAIWSCVPYLVGSRRQATAYGYLTSSTNISSTILPIIVAALVSSDQSYFQVGLFFASLGLMGCLITLRVSVLNRKQSLGLNSSRIPSHMASFYQVNQQHQQQHQQLDPKGSTGFNKTPKSFVKNNKIDFIPNK